MQFTGVQTLEAFSVLGSKLAEQAARILGSLAETHYSHNIHIDAEAGVFDVDCSGFVSHLLQQVAHRHYQMIAMATKDGRPLARDYHTFAAALTPSTQRGWRQIVRLADAQPGDIMAWQLHDAATGDTGHVFVVAKAPVMLATGKFFVAVYDSSSLKHFDDTRGDRPGQFANGVGSGAIKFQTDVAGVATAFQFNRAAHLHTVPIAIARIERFSDS